jgi:predicted RNase H-like nuclease (RuvC/YqgF family)
VTDSELLKVRDRKIYYQKQIIDNLKAEINRKKREIKALKNKMEEENDG